MEEPAKPFPKIKLPCFQGILLPDVPEFVNDVEKKMNEIKNCSSRESDILLCASMKSGSHWVMEILAMLLSGKSSACSETVVGSNLEQNTVQSFDNRPDPRILHSHLPYRFLPTKHIENGYKIVLVLRNPKDRLVSYFTNLQSMRSAFDEIKWSDYFTARAMVENVPQMYGNWFDYTREWDTHFRTQTNIYPVYFEDLKMDFISNVKKLAEFLGVERDISFYHELEKTCSFDYMKQNKEDDLVALTEKGLSKLYRKGVVGDWKTLFTVAQNEQFDALYKRKMEGCNITFVYE